MYENKTRKVKSEKNHTWTFYFSIPFNKSIILLMSQLISPIFSLCNRETSFAAILDWYKAMFKQKDARIIKEKTLNVGSFVLQSGQILFQGPGIISLFHFLGLVFPNFLSFSLSFFFFLIDLCKGSIHWGLRAHHRENAETSSQQPQNFLSSWQWVLQDWNAIAQG